MTLKPEKEPGNKRAGQKKRERARVEGSRRQIQKTIEKQVDEFLHEAGMAMKKTERHTAKTIHEWGKKHYGGDVPTTKQIGDGLKNSPWFSRRKPTKEESAWIRKKYGQKSPKWIYQSTGQAMKVGEISADAPGDIQEPRSGAHYQEGESIEGYGRKIPSEERFRMTPVHDPRGGAGQDKIYMKDIRPSGVKKPVEWDPAWDDPDYKDEEKQKEYKRRRAESTKKKQMVGTIGTRRKEGEHLSFEEKSIMKGLKKHQETERRAWKKKLAEGKTEAQIIEEEIKQEAKKEKEFFYGPPLPKEYKAKQKDTKKKQRKIYRREEEMGTKRELPHELKPTTVKGYREWKAKQKKKKRDQDDK